MGEENQDDGGHEQRRAGQAPGDDARALLALAIAKPVPDEPDGENAPETARTVEDIRCGCLAVKADGGNDHQSLQGETSRAGENPGAGRVAGRWRGAPGGSERD